MLFLLITTWVLWLGCNYKSSVYRTLSDIDIDTISVQPHQVQRGFLIGLDGNAKNPTFRSDEGQISMFLVSWPSLSLFRLLKTDTSFVPWILMSINIICVMVHGGESS